MRFLLTNLFYTDDATLEDVEAFINNRVDQMTLPKDDREPIDFSQPDPNHIFRLFDQQLEIFWADKVMRTHHTLNSLVGLIPQSLGYIYLIRHPLDVALSCLNYDLLCHPDLDPAAFKQDYLRKFIESRGASALAAKLYKIDWIRHVESWAENTEDLPGVVIRYEDLLTDTTQQLKGVSDFLGFEVDDRTLERAIAASDFSRLRKVEEQAIQSGKATMMNTDAVLEQRHKQGFRFVNQGKVGLWRSHLTAEEIALAKDVFAPTAEKFGYTFE